MYNPNLNFEKQQPGLAMCLYYLYNYNCGHLEWIFAELCDHGRRYQNPCGRRDIWQEIHMNQFCKSCYVPTPKEGKGTPNLKKGKSLAS